MTDIARKEPSQAKGPSQAREAPSQRSSDFRRSVLLIEIPVGFLFSPFNFDGFMRFVARHYVLDVNQSSSEWIIDFSYLLRYIYAMLHQTEVDLFIFLLYLALCSLCIYFALFLLSSFREEYSMVFLVVRGD
jgi:hypothetical protein